MMKPKHDLVVFSLTSFILAALLGALPAAALAPVKPETIVFVTEPEPATAITKLEDLELDIYAAPLYDPLLLARVESAPNLDYFLAYGSYNELTFNPAGPIFNNGKLNPFSVPEVREAMHYLVDREYLAQEIFGGLAVPRWTPLNTASLDHVLLASEVQALESEYAYNQLLGKQIIDAEMLSLGAVKVGGIWRYAGEPVEIIVLIRIEDERLQIGDYVADQLEAIGFEVFRDYKSSAEASPIWLMGDPLDGGFHIYTGGWISLSIPRDQGGDFAFFYTDMGLPVPLWQAYVNDPAFYDLAERLQYADYSSAAERYEMMTQALKLSMEDSVRIFLNDRLTFTPKHMDVSLASDLYGGINQTRMWAKTLEWATDSGSTLTIGLRSLFNGAWNPVAGINWGDDIMPLNGTAETALVTDPYTGLALPDRVDHAEVVIQEGFLVSETHDWVDLSFAEEIVVPTDAWGAWDAVTQSFITVGDLYREPVTALRKSTVYYPADLYDTVKWHDGSPFSIADIIMAMILTFDRGQEDSPIYDISTVQAYTDFMEVFKGVKIVSEDPLIIETYMDTVNQDAELNVTTWWPFYGQSQAAWHALTLGILAETDGNAAFSEAKADSEGIRWMDYVTGSSVAVLNGHLDDWNLDPETIPYVATLGNYIQKAELTLRLANLEDWYDQHGHFWIGTGPYYLEEADPGLETVVLQKFADHPDPDDKWADYAEDPIPNIHIEGADSIALGEPAVFDIFITKGTAASSPGLQLQNSDLLSREAFPVEDIERVDYLLAAHNKVYLTGQAEFIDGSLWRVVVDEDMVRLLPSGPVQLEVVVTSGRVVIPSSGAVGIQNNYYNSFLPLISR